MPPQQPNKPNFDFIVNPGQAPKKQLLPTGGSAVQRAIIVGVGVVLLIIAAVVVNSLLTSGSKEQQATLLKAAQQQAELVRVANLGTTASTQDIKNLAINTSLTMTSDQKQLIDTLASAGMKINQKQLLLGKNPDTDEAFAAAQAAANFDATFTASITEQLTAYQTTLQNAYNNSRNPDVQGLLKQQFANAGLLLQQASPAQQ